MEPGFAKEAYDFIQARGFAVVSTVTSGGLPEAALVAIAASPKLDLVFDTVSTSRKYANLMLNPAVALVIGFADETTLQCEGIAELPEGEERERCREIYFERWPDGRDRLSWPGIVHFRVKLRWLRLSDYNRASGQVREMELPAR